MFSHLALLCEDIPSTVLCGHSRKAMFAQNHYTKAKAKGSNGPDNTLWMVKGERKTRLDLKAMTDPSCCTFSVLLENVSISLQPPGSFPQISRDQLWIQPSLQVDVDRPKLKLCWAESG